MTPIPASMAKPDQVFHWNRSPPTGWVAQLRLFTPPREAMGWLECWWEPGTPEDPTQRWVLYELTPQARRFAAAKVELLLAIGPPCHCAYQPTEYGTGRCRRCQGKRSPGFARMYARFQATGTLPEPFWILQGDQGGHRVDYTTVEEQWDRLLGGPGVPPPPGMLPYAGLDQRTFTALRRFDRACTAWNSLATADAQREEQAARDFRTALWDHAGRMAEQIADAQGTAALLSLDLPRHDREPDWDARRDRYITTGQLL